MREDRPKPGRRTWMFVVAGVLLAFALWSLRSADRPASATRAIPGEMPSARTLVVAIDTTKTPRATPTFETVDGPRLDLEGLSVVGFIDRMAPLARRGDADVAYRVYQAERMCSVFEIERKWVREATISDAMRDDLIRSIARGATWCADVTPAQQRERLGFLDQATRAGNHAAMLDYRNEGPFGIEIDIDIESLDPNDSRLVEWKRRSNGYLEGLAAQGERDAWMWLATDYQTGRYVARDFAAAIKYRAALVTSGAQPDRDPMTVGYVADMAQTMAPADVQAAIEQGIALGRRFPRVRP